MLIFKAWCETRARFAIGLVTLAVVIALGLAQAGGGDVWAAVYSDSTKTSFVLLAIVLGTGSLRQEHALGTLGFSLALPVARTRMVAARAGVGIAEVWLLAGFVALWVPVIAGLKYPISHSIAFVVIWSVVGSLILCIAQLLASLLASDYHAWLLTFLLVIGYEALIQLTALRDQPGWDPFRLMSDPTLGLPWPSLAAMVGLCAALLAAASLRARRLAL
jgi:ABC-type transport system involved in multi-copper enzyme maturation permease subunit